MALDIICDFASLFHDGAVEREYFVLFTQTRGLRHLALYKLIHYKNFFPVRHNPYLIPAALEAPGGNRYRKKPSLTLEGDIELLPFRKEHTHLDIRIALDLPLPDLYDTVAVPQAGAECRGDGFAGLHVFRYVYPRGVFRVSDKVHGKKKNNAEQKIE